MQIDKDETEFVEFGQFIRHWFAALAGMPCAMTPYAMIQRWNSDEEPEHNVHFSSTPRQTHDECFAT
jgi:hypothetical protein